MTHTFLQINWIYLCISTYWFIVCITTEGVVCDMIMLKFQIFNYP